MEIPAWKTQGRMVTVREERKRGRGNGKSIRGHFNMVPGIDFKERSSQNLCKWERRSTYPGRSEIERNAFYEKTHWNHKEGSRMLEP